MVLNNLGKGNLKDILSKLKISATRHFQLGADFKAAFPESQEMWQKWLEPVIANCLHKLQTNAKVPLENSGCRYFMLSFCEMKIVRNGYQIYIGEILKLSQLVD